MKFRSFACLLCLLALRDTTAFANAPDDKQGTKTAVPKAALGPFFRKYCIDCHGPDDQNGQLRFDRIAWDITNNDSAQKWQDILDVLNAGDMPPEEADQPQAAELSRTLDTLTGTLLKARRRLTDHGGEITLRRLNRREYANTIQYLFGFRISPDLIPPDGEAETFDTVGAEQLFTSAHLDSYLELGTQIGEWGFLWSAKPHKKPRSVRSEPEERITKRVRSKLADLDRKMAMKQAGKTWQEMGFKDAGEAEIVFSQFKTRAGKRRRYLQYPQVDTGMYVSDVNNETRRFSVSMANDPRASYRYRVRAGIVDEPPEVRQFLQFSDKTGPLTAVRVRGTEKNPELAELLVPAELPNRVASFSIEENRADIRALSLYLKRLKAEDQWASIWVDWLEIDGPYYETSKPDNVFTKLMYPNGYVRGQLPQLRNEQLTRDFIEAFAFEAFRHQEPSKEYVDRLLELFKENRKKKQTHATAMSEVLGVILASPEFLFLREPANSQETRRSLSDHELAIRLSYFLWSAPPDDDLYRLAEKKQLSDPVVLSQQVNRLLRDPQSQSFVDGFMSQWAELDRFDAITVDTNSYVRFNKGIRLAARREVSEFFKVLVGENLSVSNLIDSNFVTVNSVLAEHYGIDGVHSSQFEKVVLPADSPRGGLMTQTAFLMAGSNGERSSPVIRGALVMEKLLHDKPAPPPPNVPELGAASRRPRTNRELVKMHQGRAVCASCHRKMDVIGFGLENFDTTGRWRDTEKVGRKQKAINPGGTLPDGSEFQDVQTLKRALLKHKPAAARQMLISLLEYASGRSVEFSDSDLVDGILSQLAADDYPMRSMIHAVVNSRLFQTK